MIDVQHRDGRSTARGFSDKHRSFVSKVCRPLIGTRIKQANHRAVAWINAGNIRSLILAASHAAQREITCQVATTMLPRRDVVDDMSQLGNPLGKMTILAPKRSSGANELDRLCIHARVCLCQAADDEDCPMAVRALDLRMINRSLAVSKSSSSAFSSSASAPSWALDESSWQRRSSSGANDRDRIKRATSGERRSCRDWMTRSSTEAATSMSEL